MTGHHSSGEVDGPVTLRLLSANIQAGASTRRYSDYATRSLAHVMPTRNSKRDALDAIATLARQHDIVGLQETDPGSWRSGSISQTRYLAERGGFSHWYEQPNRRVGQLASSANGLLSKLKPVRITPYPLPGRITGRGLLIGCFGDGEDGLVVAVVHLSLGVQSRRSQLAYIGELLCAAPHAILMGDFNCTPDCPEMEILYRATCLQPPDGRLRTFPSWNPRRSIDHILTTPTLTTLAIRAVPAASSDHLAVSMELDVPANALDGSIKAA